MFNLIYILCGKIASGKTTYAGKLKKEKNAVILSCDNLMLTLYDYCLGDKHDETTDKCLRYFYSLAEQFYYMNINVIIDFGYWTRIERKRAVQYFNDRNIPFEIHYIKVDEQKRLKQLEERNIIFEKQKERNYIIKGELLKRLDSKFEEPSKEEFEINIKENKNKCDCINIIIYKNHNK